MSRSKQSEHAKPKADVKPKAKVKHPARRMPARGTVDRERRVAADLFAACFSSFRRGEFALLELGPPGAPDGSAVAESQRSAASRTGAPARWLKFFPNARFYCFDPPQAAAASAAHARPARIEVVHGDLSNVEDVARLIGKIPSPRIVLDRAPQVSSARQRAFIKLFAFLEPGGFYVLEDLHSRPERDASLADARPMAAIVQEFLDLGTLTLDFASAEESAGLAAQIAQSFVARHPAAGSDRGPGVVIFQKRTNSLNSIGGADDSAAPHGRALERDWLTSRLFSFRGKKEGPPYTTALRFETTGRISGHNHRNESSWRLSGGQLTILRDDGVATCVASPLLNRNGTISFVGRFLLSDLDITHRFEENAGDNGLPCAFSFDLFDTLVARRCHDPVAIFDAVETKSGVAGFAQLRRDVESKLWREGDYSFDDIYAALAEAAGWDAAILRRLRTLEIAEEWANLFPIKETVLRVRPGDLIVSDMYLPESFLRRIVEDKCGLKDCVLHVSSHGKSRGEIWAVIAGQRRILRHHGDNQHSDVESARRAKLHAEHVTLARWTRGEQILGDANLGDFAALIRETRLATYDPDPLVRAAQLAQFDCNIPLLLVGGLYLLGRATERGVDVLLMCSRDCNLWVHLMQWLASRSAQSPAVKYFISSRVLLLSDDEVYQAYYWHMRGRRSMIVDVSGTGRSPAYFLARTGDQTNASVFLLAGTTFFGNFVKNLAPTQTDVDIEILTHHSHDRRLAIESLNMCLEGRSHQMEFNGGSFEARQLPHEFGTRAQGLIAGMRTAFLEAVARLARSATIRLPDGWSPDALRSTAEALIELVAHHRPTCGPIRLDVNREEANIERLASEARLRNQALRTGL